MRNLLAGGKEVDRRDFLARADLLAACGITVLISDYFEYYRLAAYLSWRTKKANRHRHGRALAHRAFRGKILHRTSRRHSRKLRTPLQTQSQALRLSSAGLAKRKRAITVNTMKVVSGTFETLRLPRRPGQLRGTRQFRQGVLSIFSRDVLAKIAEGDEELGNHGSEEVADLIKTRKFFGYPAVVEHALSGMQESAVITATVTSAPHKHQFSCHGKMARSAGNPPPA